MDVFTHGLASYSVTRAAFPRASRTTLLAAVLAGGAADLDQLSAYVGPSAFLELHRTATHSILGTLVIVAAFLLLASITVRNKPQAEAIRAGFLALLVACSLHVALDLTQNESVQLLCPFRSLRYSFDCAAHFAL